MSLSTEQLTRIAVPAGLIVAGTAFLKSEWLPYAVVAAVALSGVQLLQLFLTRKPDFHTAL